MAIKFTLTTVVALVVAAASSSAALAIGTPDAADRAAVATQANMLDARERALGVSYEPTTDSGTTTHPVRDDRFGLHPTTIVVPAAVTDVGRDLEWPQVGIGLVAGILLAIGLGLTLGLVRTRPLAH